MGKSRIVFALFVFFSVVSALRPDSGLDLAFSPDRWDFQTIIRGDTAIGALTVVNNGALALGVTLTPACGCLRADPARIDLAPGASGSFRLFYDSSDDVGKVEKSFIVGVGNGGGPAGSRLYVVEGTVKEPPDAVRPEAAGPNTGGPRAGSSNGRPVLISYYYTPGCRSCGRFLSEELPGLERDLGIKAAVENKDALDPAVFGELEKRMEALGIALSAFPVLITGDTVLQGEAEIRGKLPALLAGKAPGAGSDTGGGGASAGVFGEGLAALPVLAGGLLDGVNPCAFTTLIFLLASLALAGKGRGEVLVIGLLFSLSVFATYLAIGLGFFAALRAAAAYTAVSLILRWVLAAVLLVFAGLSVYDFTKIRAGMPTEILLQLPIGLKKSIHTAIRTRVRTVTLAGSSLALGFLVSVFEFACTGQVYLPTLAYLVRGRTRALPLLLLYNFGFIVPLLAVFAAAYFGVGSKRIAGLFQRHMAAVKIGLALFFLCLAVVTLAG